MLWIEYWEWVAFACLAVLWLVFVTTGGSGISHVLTIVFTACLSLSII